MGALAVGLAVAACLAAAPPAPPGAPRPTDVAAPLPSPPGASTTGSEAAPASPPPLQRPTARTPAPQRPRAVAPPGPLRDPFVAPPSARAASVALPLALVDPFAGVSLGPTVVVKQDGIVVARLELRDPFTPRGGPALQRPTPYRGPHPDLQDPFAGGRTRWRPCAPATSAAGVVLQRPAGRDRVCADPGPLRDPFEPGPPREPAPIVGAERSV